MTRNMATTEYHFDWADLAFGSKKTVSALKATFIQAPREMSQARLKQLIKTYLPKGNIVIGLAKEQHIDGFENQLHFKTLQQADIDALVQKVNAAPQAAKIYTLDYFQREITFIYEQIKFRLVVLVNGSWKYSYHTQAPFYALVKNGIHYEFVSPFADEDEAQNYARLTEKKLHASYVMPKGLLTADEMMSYVTEVAKLSFDNSSQVGAVVGKAEKGKYRFLIMAYNKVVPYQTYAMHHGASREANFSPVNDQNHYDAVHAEIQVLLEAIRHIIDLKDTTLFINVLPCPTCARMIADSPIKEVIYKLNHSSGYANNLFTRAAKKITQV